MRLIQSVALTAVVTATAAVAPLGFGSQHQSTYGPRPNAGHVMTTAGGGGGVLLFADRTWSLSAGVWQPVAVGGPSNRSMAAGAFDTRRGVLVVFGGLGIRSGSRYGDTWEWNGQTWTERDVRTPGIRDHHAMAYDEARGQMVMYGGWDADRKFPGDTWTWDGTVWTRADTATGPGGAGHLAMAYDSRRQRVVMYGGDTPERPATSDTWEWDGRVWHRVAVDGPQPRTRHRLAYDAARGLTVLFGGQIGSGPGATFPEDTWGWNGTAWTKLSDTGPPPRYMPSLAYDHGLKRVVLFGGNRGGRPYDALTDLWEFDGVSWRAVQPGTVSAAERVEALLAAMGGREVWARTKFVHVRATHRDPRLGAYANQIWNDFTAPRVRIEAVIDGDRVTRVLNGTSGWRVRRGETVPLTAAQIESEHAWWESNVYRTIHRLAVNDPDLIARAVGDNRLEMFRADGRRLNWLVLNAAGEPIRFGTWDDERGSVFGPMVQGSGGIRHWRWGASADGTFQFEISEVTPAESPPGGIAFGRDRIAGGAPSRAPRRPSLAAGTHPRLATAPGPVPVDPAFVTRPSS